MPFSDLSNEELDTAVSEIIREFRIVASKRMPDFVLARGFRVQQARVYVKHSEGRTQMVFF